MAAGNLNPTGRFSDRVESYVRYRPHYPGQILNTLTDECGFTADSIVADIGSGTGILAKLFLENGNTVYGVEPNDEMRQAGEQFLQNFSNFKSVKGKAENTILPVNSVNFVTAGQAFHWFDRQKCKVEFKRILAESGWLVLIWNDRLLHANSFLKDYESLLHTHGTDYDKVQHRSINNQLVQPVFGSNRFSLSTFKNSQTLDYEGLQGRLLSSSYVPNRDQPGHGPMINALRRVFDEHQINGEVRFEYETKMFYGQL